LQLPARFPHTALRCVALHVAGSILASKGYLSPLLCSFGFAMGYAMEGRVRLEGPSEKLAAALETIKGLSLLLRAWSRD